MTVPVAFSNSLADLAARIRIEHTAVATALKDSLRHALAAGDLLLEAKEQVGHGQWLPWLRDHCDISERTAQLYMRVAKNRAEIETQIRNDVADLTLSEATALLALSTDARRLIRFIRDCGNLEGDELIKACIAANIPVIVDDDYHPFAGRREEEIREWNLFMLLLARDGWWPQGAAYHTEWILQRPFQNVGEWLGEEGDNFRRACCYPEPEMPEFKQRWEAFRLAHADLSLPEISAELEKLEAEWPAKVSAARRKRPRAARMLQRARR